MSFEASALAILLAVVIATIGLAIRTEINHPSVPVSIKCEQAGGRWVSFDGGPRHAACMRRDLFVDIE